MNNGLPIHQPHTHREPVSHACIHDCNQCHRSRLHANGFFENFIRGLIRFPATDEKPIDCRNTKVDLSCLFGGNDFQANQQQKTQPTLVEVKKAQPNHNRII